MAVRVATGCGAGEGWSEGGGGGVELVTRMAAGVWGSDDGDGHEGGVMVAAVGRQPEEVEARGGEWIWGSGRSGHEDNIWFRPERSPENFSGGGGMVAGGGGRREGWPEIWRRWRRKMMWYNVDENDEGGGVGCWSDSRGEVVFGWWGESERRFVVEMMTVVLLAIRVDECGERRTREATAVCGDGVCEKLEVRPGRSSETRRIWPDMSKDAPEFNGEESERANDIIISWILNTISEQIGDNLSFVNSATSLWNELYEHYSQLDGHRIYQVSNDIVQLKQTNTLLSLYYHKLKGYWDELDALEAPYACTCKCDYESGKTNGEREQRKSLIQFLMGLDDSYTNGDIAFKDQNWRDATTKEIQALKNNKTWTFTTLPLGKTPNGSKWVYKIKLKADGVIDRYKDRLVAKGFNQKEGIDYTETFAPVAKMPTVRTLIAIAVHNGWPIQQLDVNNAFLYDDLNEEFYMTVSQGYPHNLPPNTSLDLLKYADTLDIKPVATPMDPIVKLNEVDGDPLPGHTQYRTIVGKLIYLTLTRPDLSFAVQALSQFSHNPRTPHLVALHRVLRYIKLCYGHGIYFPASNKLELTTYCDSDWASCQTTRRSVLGYAIFLGNSLISWQSKKQLVVSRSSSEAEYRSLADSTCEISWLKCLLHDIGINIPTPSLVMCDNALTIALANNPVQHARTKHIEIDCHFVRDKIRQGHIKPIFVSSQSQIADILTKGLNKYLHYSCLSKLNICDPYTVSTCWGGGGIKELPLQHQQKVNQASIV
ncbi:uncharacterized mitochondrial protein-like protein [Tanacetum coccineum]